jgi:hypothetical protein
MSDTYYQQGDLLLFAEPIPDVPAAPKEGLVLLEGERTGHAHRVDGGGGLLDIGGTTWLVAASDVTIVHDEHRPIRLPAGTYRMGRVQEWDHTQDVPRGLGFVGD